MNRHSDQLTGIGDKHDLFARCNGKTGDHGTIALATGNIGNAFAAPAGDPVFITVTVEPKDEAVRVQQQLHYKVRLYSKHPILDGVLSDPQPTDAVVEQLGEDRKGSAR
ncbi:MAG: hypothetical protein ACPGYL_09500, partial [Rhodospirillaceae bacterium]